MTRPIQRIPAILSLIGKIWVSNPDLRLGQLLGNAQIDYYTEDLTDLVQQLSSVYDTTPILWGTYGKDGNEPLHYLELSQMSTSHIMKCVKDGHTTGKTKDIFINEVLKRKNNEQESNI